MAEKKAGKCAHPGCECRAPKGTKFCSPYKSPTVEDAKTYPATPAVSPDGESMWKSITVRQSPYAAKQVSALTAPFRAPGFLGPPVGGSWLH